MPGISIAEVEFRMLSSVHFTNANGIGSFFGELFRKILPYLNKSARVVGKEVLHAGINVTEDVKNNKPLKEAVKSWLDNLKTKEKISFLMRGCEYIILVKSAALQFPVVEIDVSCVGRSKENH